MTPYTLLAGNTVNNLAYIRDRDRNETLSESVTIASSTDGADEVIFKFT
jgi:hypothetical protein